MTNITFIDTDADITRLLAVSMTPADVAADLCDAGFDAKVEWARGDMGKVTVGGIVIVVENGRAGIERDCKTRYGHGVVGCGGVVYNPTLTAIEEVIAA